MKEAKSIIDQFFSKTKEAAQTLSELEARAGTIKGQGKRRKAAHADIRAAEATVEALRQERGGLMRSWSEADFEGDVQRKAQITKRRLAVDAEVKKLEKEVDRLHKVASEKEPDTEEVAALAVALDAINYPNAYDFCEELKRVLRPQDSDLSDRRRTAKNMLPSVDMVLYEKAMYGEEEYAKRQRVEALKREDQARKAEKLRDSIRRSELAGAPRVMDGRVSERELKPWED